MAVLCEGPLKTTTMARLLSWIIQCEAFWTYVFYGIRAKVFKSFHTIYINRMICVFEMNRRLLLGLVFCLLVQSVYCEPLTNVSEPSYDAFTDDPFFSGDASVVLDKDTYSPGDLLKANITLQNMEDFPLVDVYPVVEIVVGKKHVYPTEISNDNNVFYETVTGPLNLAPGRTITIPFSYSLPLDLSGGNYLLEVYAETKRTPVVGIPSIFLSPQGAPFSVVGGGSFPSAKILWNETIIGGVTGQETAALNASSMFSGRVFIKNRQNADADCVLNLTVCEWDDVLCTEGEQASSKQYELSLKANETYAADVELKAPEKPNVYAMRLELIENGRTVSIYRSRIIVTGPAARIRKIVPDDFYYRAGQKGRILLVVGPSPDHFTFPVLNNTVVSVSIAPVNGTELNVGSFTIPELSIDAGPVFHAFEFTSPVVLRDYTICSKVESANGTLLDSYCFMVDSSKFLSNETFTNVSWDYDSSNGSLSLQICAYNQIGENASSKVSVFLMTPAKSLEDSAQSVFLDSCSLITLSARAGEHFLFVNNLDTNKQTEMKINLLEKNETTQKHISVCGNNQCEPEETQQSCCLDCGCSQNAECVNNRCQANEQVITAGSTEPVQNPEKEDRSFFYAGAVIIVIGLLLFILRYKKKKE